MKILALEFSSAQRSVAVLQAGPAGAVRSSEVIEAGERSTRGLAMIEQALREAQLDREEIEVLAIGLGPGSYTGIRAAIALGQGWQLARPIKLLGLSSVECLAAQAQADHLRGGVNVVIDAQRNEFYIAKYQLETNGWKEIQPLRLASRPEVQRAVTDGEVMLGPDAGGFENGRVLFPRAAVLAELARHRRDYILAEAMQPIYLRATSFVKAPRPRILPK